MEKSVALRAAARDHEVILVDPDVDQVYCDGGVGPLGHPRVYYSLDDRKSMTCLYCDRMFMKNEG